MIPMILITAALLYGTALTVSGHDHISVALSEIRFSFSVILYESIPPSLSVGVLRSACPVVAVGVSLVLVVVESCLLLPPSTEPEVCQSNNSNMSI